jgi:hypothetical protein
MEIIDPAPEAQAGKYAFKVGGWVGGGYSRRLFAISPSLMAGQAAALFHCPGAACLLCGARPTQPSFGQCTTQAAVVLYM